ncbi:MAG TPA: sigma-70 family RNA polymerase sigma factor [Thermomicrobiales bacterium]|nr:sigma-70 family RNA polymerase sigma factor [Thermomicrobiales bacterium]
MHAPSATQTAATAAARTAFITRNIPLVHYVAGRMTHAGAATALVEYADMVGYGCEGLIAAVDTFDPTRNVCFSTWAVLHIRTTIQDRLRRLDPLPRSVQERRRAIDRVSQEFAARTGRWPTEAELAAALDLPPAVLRETLRLLGMVVVSLDVGHPEHDDDERAPAVADEHPTGDPQRALDAAATSAVLRAALSTLPERERTIVVESYLRGRELRPIGRELGISEARVSQLRRRALSRLRRTIQELLAAPPSVPSAA